MSKTIFYQPFVSTSVEVSSSANSLQGVKKNDLAANSYLLTGTSGNAIAPPGYGALYIGAIDGSTTTAGSGSGTWYNFSVPSTWGANETSVYGPDILSPGQGPDGIGDVALAGTWINASGDLLGWYYSGSILGLDGDTSGATTAGFQSFQAKTRASSPAKYTYLHSVDGGYVVGNYTTTGGPIALAINSGLNSGSFIFNPKSSSQVDIQYSDKSRFHSAFGVWANEDNTFTISGGASGNLPLPVISSSHHPLKPVIISPLKTAAYSKQDVAISKVFEAFPDAVLGSGMLADVDPVTGIASNVQHYNYKNRPDVLTHFQGIDYLGSGVYQAPFVAVDKAGQLQTGNAYMHRLGNGLFAKDAVWETFVAGQDGGSPLISTSVAGNVNTGVYSTLAPFASFGPTEPYLAAAQHLNDFIK